VILRKAIQLLRSILGRKHISPPNDSAYFADTFVRRGCEYYASARFAMHAGQSYISGNLFHHAVEMLLKAGLANNGTSLSELRDMGHRLRKLWRAYKDQHTEAGLERHNKTIKGLDKFEDIRYPNPDLHSIGVAMEWSSKPFEVKTFGGLRAPKQYPLRVSSIDDLVADVLKASLWNPGVFMGNNEAALEAVKRHNEHAIFLTTVMKC
jgi:HEPN domain-containing protein